MGKLIWHEFDSPRWLIHALAQTFETQTTQAIETQGEASWVLSGGASPKKFYQHLSGRELPWAKITCLLTDERCLSEGHPKTNATMLWTHLLKHHPECQWLPIFDCAQANTSACLSAGEARINRIKKPYTLVLLGMGPDGHTASLFPGCEQSQQTGLNPNARASLVYTQSPQYPQERISLTLPQLVNTQHLVLLIMGKHKRGVLEAGLKQTQTDHPDYRPIHHLIQNSPVDIQVYWSAQEKICT